jgi:transcriptional regulator with XRE-family HTH domain
MKRETAAGLGGKIKKLRKQRKLSQEDVAAKAGINPTHLSRLENDRYQPSIDVVKKLAEMFEVSVDYLLSDDDGEAGEVQIRNKPLAERIRLIDSLDDADQQALIQVIDSMLTKQRMRQVLEERPAAPARY